MSEQERRTSQAGLDVPDTMQAVIASGRGFENLTVKEIPVPHVGPDQLLARVDAAGVCTSNLKLIAQGEDHIFMNGWNMEEWPIILGDEGAVTLVRVGDNLKRRYFAGQRYVVQPAVDMPPVRHRERYRNNAEGMRKCAVGYTLPGHLAQYMLIQEEVLEGGCLLPLPDEGIPYFAASMAEPISCVYSAQERNYHIRKEGPASPREPAIGLLGGGVTVVRGAGVMGRMHAELALRFRPRVLIVADHRSERLDRTMQSIADKAVQAGCRLLCVSPDDLESTLHQVAQGKGADDFILAIGVREEQQRALSLLADGGVANLFGGLPQGEHILGLDALAVHYREIKVVGSSGGEPSDLSAALKAIAEGHIDAGNYVGAVGSLDNAIDVLKMIRDRKLEGRAILYPHVDSKPLQMVDRWSKAEEGRFLRG